MSILRHIKRILQKQDGIGLEIRRQIPDTLGNETTGMSIMNGISKSLREKLTVTQPVRPVFSFIKTSQIKTGAGNRLQILEMEIPMIKTAFPINVLLGKGTSSEAVLVKEDLRAERPTPSAIGHIKTHMAVVIFL